MAAERDIDRITNAGAILDEWWNKYCPSCRSRRPMSEIECPEDGTLLRDLSVTASWSGESRSASTRAAGSADALESAAPVPPRILGGKWLVGPCRGGGGFGSFFQGTHAVLGMQVGIKILRGKYTSTSFGRSMFHQEAMRVSLLNHPNIVKVFDYGEEEGRPYLVMEYLSGRPMVEYLSEGTLSLEDGVEVIRQAAIALMAAHRGASTGEPLVHLDLKPEHIFMERVQERWHVKVIDFGIAEIASAPDAANGSGAAGSGEKLIAGTLPYMAPERWDGVVDPRCDIYSLGIILYELVAGRKPFHAPSPEVMHRLHREQVPSPPSRHRLGRRTPALQAIDSIALWALEKKPEERPEDAGAFLRALEKWQARPKLTRTHRTARAALVPFAIILLAAGLFYWGPWENIVLSTSGVTVGPQGATGEVTGAISGVGYGGGETLLVLRKGGESGEVRLGKVDGQRVQARIAWEDLMTGLEARFEAGEWEARVRVEGRLWRTVTSEPFRIVLDDQPPVLEVAGPAREEEGRLLMPGSELVIEAEERLDIEACRITTGEGKVLTGRLLSPGREPREVKFEVPEGTAAITLELADRVGNTARKAWDLKWVPVPRVISSRELLTNQPDFVLEIDLDAPAGKLQVQVDDEEPEEVAAVEPPGRYRVPLRFDAEEKREQRRKVQVLTWSELAGKRGEPPEGRAAVEVKYLKRRLAVEARGGEGPHGLPRSFHLVDEGGAAVLEPGAEWQTLASLDDGSLVRTVEARVDGAKGGDLVLGEDPETLQGKLILQVWAADPYGNRSDVWVKDYAIGLEPPAVSLSLVGEEGTAARPLLHEDCPCRKSRPGSRRIVFSTRVAYRLPDALTLELRINDPTSGEKLQLEPDGDGRISVPEERILPFLEEGENTVYLVATDAKATLSRHASSDLHYGRPLAVAVSPGDERPCARSPLQVAVRTGGPKVKDVEVGGRRAAPRPGAPGVFLSEIDVAPEGETAVRVLVRLENGCEYSEVKRYGRQPLAGVAYRFPVGGEVGDLLLHYLPRGESAGEFYYTPRAAWLELVETFRKSRTGRKLSGDEEREARPPPPGSPGLGVSWREASRVVAWLTGELRKAGWLGRDQAVDLPTLLQVKAIHATGPPAANGVEVDEPEWLSSKVEEDRVDGFPASLAPPGARGGARSLGADDREDIAPFRLVVPSGGEGNRFVPKNAARSGKDQLPPKDRRGVKR